MRVVMKFTLPEDAEEYKLAREGSQLHGVLLTLREAFRSHRKYDTPPVTEGRFFEILEEYGVQLDA